LDNKDMFDEKTIQYLQMIQSVIERMSTTSAIFKGFCATIVAGVFAVSFTEINKWTLILTIIPVSCFLMLDIYYLRLEKRFRALYNSVREGKKEVDFDLTPPPIKTLRIGDAGLWSCFMSPSIYLFYIPVLITSALMIYLKFRGVV